MEHRDRSKFTREANAASKLGGLEKGGTPLEKEPPAEPSKTEELKKQLAEAGDKYLRLAAEMDNLRKRADREREELLRYGNERLLKEILQIKDHLELALQHSEGVSDIKVLREGVLLTEKELDKILKKVGLHPVPTVGEQFDPAIHEAISQEPTTQAEPGTVVREYQKGYLFHEKLLRPAKVSVAAAPSQTAPHEVKNEKNPEK
ncbi:MAG: nucleotide exchange factor GrpE [Deltaproteobacteria bacterium]|nr:nucleotide exchange factor GrpE [Deltaproteobacteria bacterium]